MKKRTYHFFLLFNIVALVFLVSSISYTYHLIEDSKGDTINLSGFTLNGAPDDFHTRYLDKNSPNTYKFETTIEGAPIRNLGSEYYTILLFRISGNSYQVSINGTRIGTVGDPNAKRNYIWRSIHSFPIEQSLIKDINNVTIDIFPTYKVGMSNFPILITTPATGYMIFDWINNMFLRSFSYILNLLIYGSILFFTFLLISGRFNRDSLIYLLAAFFASLYMLNYMTIYNLPISILAFKKLQYSSLFLGTSLASIALYYKYNKKINLYLGLALIPAILITIFTPNFHTVTNKLNTIVFLNLFGWLYCSFIYARKDKNDYVSRAFLVASLFLFFYITYDYYTVLTKRSEIVQLSNYGIINYILAFFLINFDNYFEYQNAILRRSINAEKEKELLSKQVNTDGLTSLYNHRYFYELMQARLPYIHKTALLFLDIDKFKTINDTFGHINGDTILKEMSTLIKKLVPENGHIFRYGGEEFIILLEDYDQTYCFEIAEEIRECISSSLALQKHTNFTPVTVTIGLAFYPDQGRTTVELVDKADKAMYYGKLHGRNQSNIYSRDMEGILHR